MAVCTPHGSAHDPTDPEKLLSATRIPAEGENVADKVVYRRKEVYVLLCIQFPLFTDVQLFLL